jgi:purine-binding chemotaxis protein CheW
MTEAVELELDRSSRLRRGGVDGEMPRPDERSLLCRVRHGVLCVLPLDHVDETMRPLPVVPLAGVPAFIDGLTVIRGVPTPVVNVGSLLYGEACHAMRFVTVRTGARRAVLALAAVVGVIETPAGLVEAIPQLLQNADHDAISALGVLDGELLLVLQSSRLIATDVWAAIQAQASGAAA